MDSKTVYEDRYYLVVSPDSPFNSREDGGHLVMYKREPVTDRSDLDWREAIDFMRISMAVGKAMYEELGVERMNYEDLGNWGVDDPGGPKMHLHFFGRARHEIHQIRGQHIFLHPKGHPIYEGHLEPLRSEELGRLRDRVAAILEGEQYRKLAALAEIE